MSDKTLLISGVVLLVLSIVAFISVFGLSGLTGNAVAYTNITVEGTSAISFTTSSIDFGSGSVNVGTANATLTSTGTNTGGTGWNTVSNGFVIENLGNQNVTLKIKTGKTAATFLGGTTPAYQYNVTNVQAGSCDVGTITLGSWTDVNITGDGDSVCDSLGSDDSMDSVRVDLRLVVPSDSYTGALGDTITATAAAL
jgi:hypothetical protein